MPQSSRQSLPAPVDVRQSGLFARDEADAGQRATLPLRLLVVGEDRDDLAHVVKAVRGVETLRGSLAATLDDGDARARVAAGGIDLCLALYDTDFRRLNELLRAALAAEPPLPVVVIARAEDAAAERVAASLGVVDWLVRARVSAPELERVTHNAVRRHRAMAALEAREQRFRAAFEGSADARVLLDDDERCAEANAAAKALLRLPEPTDVVRFSTRLDDDARAAFASLWATRAAHKMQELHLRVRGPSGTPVECDVTVVSQMLPGLHLVVLRDVTDREAFRAHHALAERMSSLATLAAGITHEFNNPLQVMYGNLDQLRAIANKLRLDPHVPGALLSEMDAELQVARASGERVQRVVRDLAVFTRSDREEALARVDLATPLETAVRLTANTIRHRARLERDLHPVPQVMGSVAQLTQVFVNILLNAAQAIPPGAARQNEVRVTLARTDDGRVQVAISDTGHGMSPEVIARVFDPFFTTRPVGEASGLGLSVCHGIVSALGGEILVESAPDRGSTFRVVLPVAGPVRRPSTLTPVFELAGIARRRVLVIDDDALVCRSLTRLLREHHEVVALTNPREALDRIEAGEQFDAILCDVMMPELSGIEVYQHLAAQAPEHAARLVFVTGGAFSPEARDFLESGRHRVLEKPVTQTTLLNAVARILAQTSAL